MKGKWIRTNEGEVFEVMQDIVKDGNGDLIVTCRDENNIFLLITVDQITNVFDNETEARGRIS